MKNLEYDKENMVKAKNSFVILCIGSFFLSLSPAFSEINVEKAETGKEKKDVKETGEEVEEILVSAEKTVRKIPQMSQSATTITKEMIEESTANSVMEVVKEKTPGVFATQNNITGFGFGRPGPGQLSMRGIGSSPNTQVLVMVNGRPDFMGLFGHPIADFYTLDNVEEIEVLRGHSSTLYGNAAMGGVVNITTKRRATEGFESRITTAGGVIIRKIIWCSMAGKRGNLTTILPGVIGIQRIIVKMRILVRKTTACAWGMTWMNISG